MIDYIGVVYIKIKIKLSRPIKLGAVCYENQTGKRHDRLYRCSLHQKQNLVVIIKLKLITYTCIDE